MPAQRRPRQERQFANLPVFGEAIAADADIAFFKIHMLPAQPVAFHLAHAGERQQADILRHCFPVHQVALSAFDQPVNVPRLEKFLFRRVWLHVVFVACR